MRSNSDILKGVLPNLTITLVLVLVIALFKPSFFIIAGAIIAYTLYRSKSFYATLPVCILLAIIYSVTFLFGLSALKSFFLVGFLIAAFILYTRRKELLAAIRHVEKKHFGETMEEKRERLLKNG